MLRYYQHSKIPVFVGVMLGFFAIFLFLKDDVLTVNSLQRLEAIPYDLRLKQSIPRKINNTPPIIIVDIDEKSLKQEGRFPWSRKKLATLVDKLHQQGAAVIALDILQSEPEINPASLIQSAASRVQKKLPEWFTDIKGSLDADAFFAKTIADKEVVLGYPFHYSDEIKNGNLGDPVSIHVGNAASESTKEVSTLTAIEMKGYTSNLDSFNKNAAGSGFFSIMADSDGSIRRAPLIAVYDNQIYPSLALEAARLYLMEDDIHIQSQKVGDVRAITGITLGRSTIPTDAQGQLLIPYYGKQKHFTYLSATDVLHTQTQISELENAIVLVGTSAVGLVDLRPTPVESNYPGVEIQANILHGILHPETIAYIPDWKEGAMISWIVLLTLVMALVYPLLQPISLLIAGSGLLITTYAFNSWLWVSQHVYLPVMLPLLLVFAVSGFYVAHHLVKENKDRRRIHSMFGQYVPLDHINRLIETPEELGTEGEKREMTVLFSDLRNFTALSEPLSTQELKDFLNQYLTAITKVIFDHHGTVDKYVGDLVMAFWGAPLKNPNHAVDTVNAALEMQQKITDMQADFNQLGIPKVATGIGIHTGEMNVGDMGSDYRRAYTVLGDAVNLGSRLESLTKFYGVKILVSEDTKVQCPELAFRYIDFVRVKGKQKAIKIYEPVGSIANLSEKDAQLLFQHNEALGHYQSGNWELAKAQLHKLYEQTNEVIYGLYGERIDEKSGKSPDEWQGIYTHSSK